MLEAITVDGKMQVGGATTTVCRPGASAIDLRCTLRGEIEALLAAPLAASSPLGDRQAGYRSQLFILQIELSHTQVLDKPVSGRIFFEEVIRENLDVGRPTHVQLIFDRRVTRGTPRPFRTRVITDKVVPSLHIDYKQTRIKQYHKEGRALRTETTISNARDFYIGNSLRNATYTLYARLAFKPTAACSRWNNSAMTACSPKRLSRK